MLGTAENPHPLWKEKNGGKYEFWGETEFFKTSQKKRGIHTFLGQTPSINNMHQQNTAQTCVKCSEGKNSLHRILISLRTHEAL